MTVAALVLPPQKEAAFQGQVVKIARLLGWKHIYHPWTSLHSASGWPDLFMIRGSRAIAAELKRPAGRVTALQQAWLDALAEVPGIETFIWRPADWNSIVEVLR